MIGDDAQLNAGLVAGLDDMLGHGAQPGTEPQSQSEYLLGLQPAHVGAGSFSAGGEGHAGGQQQLAAIQVGGGILQLGDMHPADRQGPEGSGSSGEEFGTQFRAELQKGNHWVNYPRKMPSLDAMANDACHADF